MGATVNIDTGGTFTDGYFTREGRAERVKVDTTPHDLTECLALCVAVGAERLGYPTVQDLLLDSDVFRFSSTIGTNSVIQRTGPRIGLLVSRGAAAGLYGDAPSPLYRFLVDPDLVAEVVDPLDSAEVRDHVRGLLVAGARILVVSLEGSHDDPEPERAIKAIVQREYPRHYLGAVPCLTASDVTPRSGAARRTATAVINAYLHPDMVRTLYKADEDLRGNGYPHPLLIVHASGGVARVAKTRAIETYNSGPVGGVHGSARLAQQYGFDHVVTMDIGGTSTDVSIITGGRVPFDPDPDIAGIRVHTPLVLVEAVGGGGGSIARRQEDGSYRVGPDSAGSVPGPAAYRLGGTEPTATDAEVVLGHIDPDWFLGGRRKLDADRARTAVERISGEDRVESAAERIHAALASVASEKVAEMIAATGVAPADFALFAFGGGGGLYAAEVARACGIPRAVSFEQSAVFSAFGISGMDISHVYELRGDAGYRQRLDELRRRARLDVAGEHLDPDSLEFELEVETSAGVEVHDPEQWSPSGPVDGLRLRATARISRPPVVAGQRGSADPAAASKGRREAFDRGRVSSVPVYDRDALAPGNIVDGPALVESADTTILVPTDSRLSVDEYRSAIIELSP